MKLENYKIYLSKTLMPFEVNNLDSDLRNYLNFKDQIINQTLNPDNLKEIIDLPENIFIVNVTKNFINHTIIDENFNTYIMSNDDSQIRYLKCKNTEYDIKTKFIAKQNTVAFYKFTQVDSENFFVIIANKQNSNISRKIIKLSNIIINYK